MHRQPRKAQLHRTARAPLSTHIRHYMTASRSIDGRVEYVVPTLCNLPIAHQKFKPRARPPDWKEKINKKDAESIGKCVSEPSLGMRARVTNALALPWTADAIRRSKYARISSQWQRACMTPYGLRHLTLYCNTLFRFYLLFNLDVSAVFAGAAHA